MKNTTMNRKLLFVIVVFLLLLGTTNVAFAQPGAGFTDAYTVYDVNGITIHPADSGYSKFGPYPVTESLDAFDVVDGGAYAIGVDYVSIFSLDFYTYNADGTTRSGPFNVAPPLPIGTISGAAIVSNGGDPNWLVLLVEPGAGADDIIHVCSFTDGVGASCATPIQISAGSMPQSPGDTIVGVNGNSDNVFVSNTEGAIFDATLYQIIPTTAGLPSTWGTADGADSGGPVDELDGTTGLDTVASNGVIAFGTDDASDSTNGYVLGTGGSAELSIPDIQVVCTDADLDGDMESFGFGDLVEVGDAPDSTNHVGLPFNMTAYAPGGGYPGIIANFPTVWDPLLPQPWGPCHNETYLWAWLGANWSSENDADLLPDNDGIVNINVTTDTPDQDFYDDGLVSINVTECTNPATLFGNLSFNVTYGPSYTGYDLYLNAWIDFNRDGDWNDTFPGYCADAGNPTEWIVRNMYVASVAGPHTITWTNDTWYSMNQNDSSKWLRMVLTPVQWPSAGYPSVPTEWPNLAPASGGGGNGTCLEDGETEDWYLPLGGEPEAPEPEPTILFEAGYYNIDFAGTVDWLNYYLFDTLALSANWNIAGTSIVYEALAIPDDSNNSPTQFALVFKYNMSGSGLVHMDAVDANASHSIVTASPGTNVNRPLLDLAGAAAIYTNPSIYKGHVLLIDDNITNNGIEYIYVCNITDPANVQASQNWVCNANPIPVQGDWSDFYSDDLDVLGMNSAFGNINGGQYLFGNDPSGTGLDQAFSLTPNTGNWSTATAAQTSWIQTYDTNDTVDAWGSASDGANIFGFKPTSTWIKKVLGWKMTGSTSIDVIGATIDSAVQDGDTVGQATLTESDGIPFIRGDSNYNGRIDIADVDIISQYLFASGPIICNDTADVNDDGSPDIADLVALWNYAWLDHLTPPSAPFPNPGQDPTPGDGMPCGD